MTVRTAPVREVSAENPLIILQTNNRFANSDEAFGAGEPLKESRRHGEEAVRAWREALPDSLKPYTYLQVSIRVRDHDARRERTARMLEPLQEAGIPCDLQVADPHDQFTFDPEHIEALLRDFDCIRAVHIAENNFEHYATFGVPRYAIAPCARYAIDLIQLAAHYGRHIGMTLQALKWMHIGADAPNRPLFETVREYGDYVLPINEHIGPQHLPRQTSVWGFWMAGITRAWGIEPQSWWFENGRMIEPGLFGQREPDNTRIMPPPLYRAMILQGAMLGATVYQFEPFWDLFDYDNARCAWEVIYPTLEEVIQRRLISSKEQLFEKAKVAYQYPVCNDINDFYTILHDVDFVHAEGLLARAAYGVWERFLEHELIPNKDQFFFVPLLPPHTSPRILEKFERVLKPGACATEAAYEEVLKKHYLKRDGEGTATINAINGHVYVMQSHENLYERQTYAVSLPKPVRGLQAVRKPGGVGLTWEADPQASLYRVHRALGEHICRPVGADPVIWTAAAAEFDDPEMRQNVPERRTELSRFAVRSPHANDVLPVYASSGEPAFLDEEADPAVTHAYAVTAVTSSQEIRRGTVNYLDYRVFSQTVSIPVEHVVVRPDGRIEHFLFEDVPDPRPETQVWHPLYSGVEERHRGEAEAIVARLDAFKAAYDAADWRRLTALYSDAYMDPNGFHREYVGRAWKWWFFRNNSFCWLRQIRWWNFADFEKTKRVRVRLFSLGRALRKDDQPFGAAYGGTVRIPRCRDEEVVFTWALEPDGCWRIVHTEPAFPCFEEMLWYSRGADNVTDRLVPGRDEAF